MKSLSTSGSFLQPKPKPAVPGPGDPGTVIQLTDDDLFEDLPENDDFSLAGSVCGKWLELQNKIGRMRRKHETAVKRTFYFTLAVLYNVFFFYALYYFSSSDNGIDWCNGFGLLVLITLVVYFGLLNRFVIRRSVRAFMLTKAGSWFRDKILDPISSLASRFMKFRFSSAVIYVVVVVGFVIFLIIDTAEDRRRLMSAFGIFILVSVSRSNCCTSGAAVLLPVMQCYWQ